MTRNATSSTVMFLSKLSLVEMSSSYNLRVSGLEYVKVGFNSFLHILYKKALLAKDQISG